MGPLSSQYVLVIPYPSISDNVTPLIWHHQQAHAVTISTADILPDAHSEPTALVQLQFCQRLIAVQLLSAASHLLLHAVHQNCLIQHASDAASDAVVICVSAIDEASPDPAAAAAAVYQQGCCNASCNASCNCCIQYCAS